MQGIRTKLQVQLYLSTVAILSEIFAYGLRLSKIEIIITVFQRYASSFKVKIRYNRNFIIELVIFYSEY